MLTPEDIFKMQRDQALRENPQKTGRKNKHPERDFQEAVVALISLQYDCTVVAIDNAKQTKLMVNKKTGRKFSIEGAGLKKQGKRKGAGDLIIHWWPAQYGYLELKWDAPQNDDQIIFEREIIDQRKGRYVLIRKDLQIIHTVFGAWGVPKKGAL